ncbi:hypothetical protein L195_g036891 [Trifolium pratense]|uniref:Uncharacterized protein n=1 Tax=Trifolium pratense TaxID=57577 RepID=A0A2K3LQU1_TRIPR|nr:hypothetical protein L195_g036891 [Trifolium pratense]
MNIGAAFYSMNLPRPDPKYETRIISSRFYCRRDPPPSPAKVHWKKKDVKPQSICTADELHHITVPNSNWKLALWRYLPSPKAPLRNHPLLLLSGVATNAIGYDLSPELQYVAYVKIVVVRCDFGKLTCNPNIHQNINLVVIAWLHLLGTCRHKDLIHGHLRFEVLG